jgi:hypothetical protein
MITRFRKIRIKSIKKNPLIDKIRDKRNKSILKSKSKEHALICTEERAAS